MDIFVKRLELRVGKEKKKGPQNLAEKVKAGFEKVDLQVKNVTYQETISVPSKVIIQYRNTEISTFMLEKLQLRST